MNLTISDAFGAVEFNEDEGSSREEAQAEAIRIWEMLGKRGTPFVQCTRFNGKPKWVGGIMEMGPK